MKTSINDLMNYLRVQYGGSEYVKEGDFLLVRRGNIPNGEPEFNPVHFSNDTRTSGFQWSIFNDTIPYTYCIYKPQ